MPPHLPISPPPQPGDPPSERIRYARENVADGKRQIILALDRPIPFGEAVFRPRWRDYDVTLVSMILDEEGNGEGQAVVGAKLKLNMETKVLEVETFGSEPVRLTKIRKEKPKKK